MAEPPIASAHPRRDSPWAANAPVFPFLGARYRCRFRLAATLRHAVRECSFAAGERN
jgi:hypothetical protein